MFKHWLFIFGIGLYHLTNAYAFQFPPEEDPEFLIRHYEVEDGLPVNSVNGIVQDEDGYLYFSTYDGLVRFDGYTFHTYNSGNTAGMESNAILGMLKTTYDHIWTVNTDGSLTQKAGNHFRTYSSPDIAERVYRILESETGAIWISTIEGVAAFDTTSQQFMPISAPLMKGETPVIGSLKNGELLAINDNGLIQWNGKQAVKLLSVPDFPIPHKEVMQIKQFSDSHIWVVGEGGAFRYDMNKASIDCRFKPTEPSVKFWNVSRGYKDVLTFTGTRGFYTYNTETAVIQPYKQISISTDNERFNLVFEGKEGEQIWLGDDEILIDGKMVLEASGIVAGFVDREGSLWVATRSDGIYQIRKSSFTNYSDHNISGLTNIYPLIEDEQEAVWAGSYVNGIYRIHAEGIENWNAKNSNLSNSVVRFLFKDQQGSIYAGLNNEGLWSYNENSGWMALPGYSLANPSQPTIEAMYRKDSTLYIGSLGPLVTYRNGEFHPMDSRNPLLDGIRVIRENKKGSLLMGSYNNGLVRVDGGSIQNYTRQNAGLSSNSIRDVFVQSNDTLWVATQDLGLNRLILDPDGKPFSTDVITTKDGLIHNSLHRIIMDDHGYFWISTNGGIMRLSRKDLNAYANGEMETLPLLLFNENDGLINREYNGGIQTAGVKTTDGRIWFPNQDGITIIDPSDFLSNIEITAPKPVIETIVLPDTSIFVDDRSQITLPDAQRNLRVTFSAPNYTYNDRVNFVYKMEGVNNRWQTASQSREAILTTISPGEHLFTLQTNIVGGEPKEASVLIIVPPFFYETRWFKILMVIAVGGLIALVFKLRIKSLQEREKKLQHRVDEQTKELKQAAEEKSRFFTGITHELKTPLSLIVGPLDDITEQQGPVSPKQFQNRLELMKRNSYRLQNLVDQILDVSKLNADAIRLTLQPVNLPELTRQIVGQFQSKFDQEDLTLNFYTDHISEHLYVDVEAWERILINLFENAIRFSPEGGTISLSLKKESSTVQVAVKDEGLGISSQDQQKVFNYLYQAEGSEAAEGTGIGLYLVKGLIEEMGGTISLHSEINKGAEFVISLQKGHSHFASVHTVHHEPLVADAHTKPTSIDVGEATHSEQYPVFEEQILIVEDNRDFRNYLQTILEEQYLVLTASNGEKALKVLKEESPDLIISDVMMPEMDGLEFVHALRKKKQFHQLPVIFLSAKNREADVETGLSTGADIYLTKPIRSNLLITQVEAVLRRERVLKSGGESVLNAKEPKFKRRVKEIVYRQLANTSLTTNMLADALYISRAKLYYEWKKVSEISINDFIKKLRLKEGKALIEERGFNVQEAALAVGFSDSGYFSTCFKMEFGVSPSQIKP